MPSALVSATYAAGDSITVTVPANARAAGDDIRRWDVSASLANDAITLQAIGSINGYALDEETPVGLPTALTLSEDDHIGLGVTVANEATLPVGTDLINGMVRFVSANAKFYRYNPRSTLVVDGDEVLTAAAGRWERAFSFSTYVSNTLDAGGGLDRDIRALSDTEVIFPRYPVDGSPGEPVDFLWYHDEGTAAGLAQGTRFTFSVTAGEQNKSRLFSNKLKLTFLGFVNLLTGELDKTGAGGVGTMAGVDEEINFVAGKTNLILQKTLPVGSGYLVRLRPQFSLGDLRNEIGVNVPLRLFLYPFSQAGNYTEAGAFFGDTVYADDDQLRVVPDAGLSVDVLEGGAIVSSFSFTDNPVLNVVGLTANIGGQAIAINGNGAAFWRANAAAVGQTESIRAIVSTESGQGQLSAVSANAVVSTATGSLSISIGYPSDANGVGDIRNDYPDNQIAGLTGKATFNPPTILVWVTRASDGQITQFTETVVVGTDQVFAITNLADGTVVGSIPGASDPAQGLFIPDTPAVTPSGTGGTLAADTYTVRAAFLYDGTQVSRVSHDSPPAIAVLTGGISDLLNDSLPFTQTLSAFTQPAIDGSVTISVGSSRVFANGVSVVLNDPAGGFLGNYVVISKPSTTQLEIQNTGAVGAVAPGETVGASSFVFPAGIQGPPGADGDDGINGINGTNGLDGIDGADGADGISGFGARLTFSTEITSGPAAGELRLDNASAAAAGQVFVSETDRNGVNISSLLSVIIDGSTIQVIDDNNSAVYAYYQVTSQTNNVGDREYTVTYLGGSGTLVGEVSLAFAAAGPQGVQGPQGPAARTIQDDGSPLPDRTNLNIVGADIVDDAANDTTVVTFTGSGGPGNGGSPGAEENLDVILLNFEGPDTSKVILDSSANDVKVAVMGDTTDIQTVDSVFGTGSLYSTTGFGSHLSISGNEDIKLFDFRNGDFTVEFDINPENTSSEQVVFAKFARKNTTKSNDTFSIACILNEAGQTAGTLYWQFSDGTTTLYSTVTAAPLPTFTWSHVALVKNGNTITQYVDGVASGTPIIFNGSLRHSDNDVVWITNGDYGPTLSFRGALDNFRVRKEAVYTSNFTKPAAEHAPQVAPSGKRRELQVLAPTVGKESTVFLPTDVILLIAGEESFNTNVTLPPGTNGDRVVVADYSGSVPNNFNGFTEYSSSIGPSPGDNIQGRTASSAFRLNTDNESVQLVYWGGRWTAMGGSGSP